MCDEQQVSIAGQAAGLRGLLGKFPEVYWNQTSKGRETEERG